VIGDGTDFYDILGNRSLKEDPPIDNTSTTVSYVNNYYHWTITLRLVLGRTSATQYFVLLPIKRRSVRVCETTSLCAGETFGICNVTSVSVSDDKTVQMPQCCMDANKNVCSLISDALIQS
jgi:hypothetical protein